MDLVWPRISPRAQLAPGVCIFGNVHIGADAQINARVSIRGDYDAVKIGRNVQLHQGVSVHTNYQKPCVIEDDAIIESGTVVHACTVQKAARVGGNSTLLDGCVITTASAIPASSLIGYDKIA